MIFWRRSWGLPCTIRRGPQAGGHQGPAIIPKSSWNFCPDLFPSPCQGTQCPSCCMREKLRGRREGVQKQTTHQKTKTKLSSATPNHDKTTHCERKRRKKHRASNVAAFFSVRRLYGFRQVVPQVCFCKAVA